MSLENNISTVVNSYITIAEESEYESFEICLRFQFRGAKNVEILTRSPGSNIYTSDTLFMPQLSKFKAYHQVKNLIIDFAVMNPTIGFTLFDCNEKTTIFKADSASDIDDRIVQLYAQKPHDVNKISMILAGCEIQIFILVANKTNSIKSVAINDDCGDENLRFAIENMLCIYPGTKTEDLKFVAIFKDIDDREKVLNALSPILHREVVERFDSVFFDEFDDSEMSETVDDELMLKFLGSICYFSNNKDFMLSEDGSYIQKSQNFVPPEIQNSKNQNLDSAKLKSSVEKKISNLEGKSKNGVGRKRPFQDATNAVDQGKRSQAPLLSSGSKENVNSNDVTTDFNNAKKKLYNPVEIAVETRSRVGNFKLFKNRNFRALP